MGYNRKVNKADTARFSYFAGILDGEGCVRIGWSVYTKRGRMRRGFLQVGNTSKEMVDWLKDNIGGNWSIDTSAAHRLHKTVYAWSMNCRAAAEVLKKALPFLVVKKAQAMVLIEFATTLTTPNSVGRAGLPVAVVEHRERLAQEMHRLNKKGIGNVSTPLP